MEKNMEYEMNPGIIKGCKCVRVMKGRVVKIMDPL